MWGSHKSQLLEQKWDTSCGIQELSVWEEVEGEVNACWGPDVAGEPHSCQRNGWLVPRGTVSGYSTLHVFISISGSLQSKSCESFCLVYICVNLNSRRNKIWTLNSCLLTTGNYLQQERKASCQNSIGYRQSPKALKGLLT